MDSVFTDGIRRVGFEKLEGFTKTDVLIIGGGITGILCAYMLKNAGIDCILAEAKHICEGVTQNTTAKITFAHGLIYDKIIRKAGKEKTKLFLSAQAEALDEYSRLCRDIECDYEQKDSYVYSLCDRKKIEREISALEALGVKAEFSFASELPIKTAGAVRVKNQAQFHPLKFAFALAKNLPIYENTKVVELMPKRAVTNNGEIAFERAIVATHFPILNKHGSYFIKMYQHRSYVLALKDTQDVNGMYIDENEKGFSFRNYGDALLLGGGAHRTGKQGGSYNVLEDFARTHYPSAKITAKWAAQDCMTLDGIPYIGRYSKQTNGLYTATGYNKWGMSSSMLAARLLTDMICGKENEYAKCFSPSRSMLHSQLAINAFETAAGLLTPTVPRCPHLGCALKYNKQEHSWDCPCHGSRFDENGKLLDNPATDDSRSI